MKRIFLILLLLLMLSSTAYAIEIPKGAYGIWWIPNQHIQQPVYKAHDWTDWQPIVDAPKSALMETWVNARMLADHYNSESLDDGRWNIRNIKLQDIAYFITQDGKYKYQCYLTAITDVGSWGYTINNKILEPASSTDIACRCCVGKDSTQNYIAVFRYVKEIK